MFNLCTKDKNFLFEDRLYKQIDDAPMRGFISPSLADFCLSYYEEKWLNDCPRQLKPVLYRRYVDDCFLLFNSGSDVAPILQYLNSQHPSLKFTCERESYNKLAFLDVLITKTPTSFNAGVFRKKTFSGLDLKFDFLSPIVICSIWFNV